MADAPTTDAPPVVISASIAYDFIMAFGGSFADHIIPDKTHVISVSFLVDSLRKQRGGVGGNIAYSLALLGDGIDARRCRRRRLRPVSGSLRGPRDRSLRRDRGREPVDGVGLHDGRPQGQPDRLVLPGPSDLAAGIDVRPFGNAARYGIVGATIRKR